MLENQGKFSLQLFEPNGALKRPQSCVFRKASLGAGRLLPFWEPEIEVVSLLAWR